MLQKIKNSNKLIVLVAVLILAVGAGAYAYQNSYTAEENEPESVVADPNFSDGTERSPSEYKEKDAKVEETSGEDEQQPTEPTVEPIVSDEGNISVLLPRDGSLLKSGDKISGTAKVDRVYFRLIDDVTGVLTQGSLKVINGKFSGKFSFNTTASEGRLDIFRTLEGGIEADVIEISVKFK